MASGGPVKNTPDHTYTGIDEFRKSVLYDESTAVAGVEEEKGRFRFLKKARENPFVPIGIISGLSALFYSAYKFKTRDPTTKLSVYLIHTRMAAQGAIVSALTLGVLYSMFNEYLIPHKEKDPSAAPHTPQKN